MSGETSQLATKDADMPTTPDNAPLLARLGTTVHDASTGRTGILMAVLPASELDFAAPEYGPFVAFLRPPGGGCEWTADPASVAQP